MPLLDLTPLEERALRETIRSQRSPTDVARARALLDIAAGESVESVCRRTGWKPSAVYRWLFEYSARRRGNRHAAASLREHGRGALKPLHEMAFGSMSPAARVVKPRKRLGPEPPGLRHRPPPDRNGRSWNG